MRTQRAPEQRAVIGRFDGGRITTDSGGLLLCETGRRIGLSGRSAACSTDHRNTRSTEHDVQAPMARRDDAPAPDPADLNDHDVLRGDSVPAMLVGERKVETRV